MAGELRVPSAIEDVIAKYERGGPCQELEVYGALAAARKMLVNPPEPDNLGAWAEVIGFNLIPNNREHNPSPWQTYFGPIASGTKEDGSVFYSPDIREAEPSVLFHWAQRARTITHPVLKARYADLTWDMSRAIAKTNPDPDMARIAIDSYLESLTKKLRSDEHSGFEAAIRALDLAITINDIPRRDAARTAVLLLHRQAMDIGKRMWWKAWDRLIEEKRAGMTDGERDALVADLESVVTRCSSPDPSVFDPHSTENAARRLIKYYNKRGKQDQARRLHEVIGKTFEKFASLGDALLASTVLQTAVNAYRDAGVQTESRRVRITMEEKIAESHNLMKPIKIERAIPVEEMEEAVGSIIGIDDVTTLARIASAFLDRREEVEKQVKQLMEEAPLLGRLPQAIMAEDHVAARVGAVDEDLLGRVIQHATQRSALSDIWLMAALERAIETHNLMPEHVVGWTAQSGLFTDLTLLLEGVSAWYDQDYVKAIHVLVPQVEVALRGIATQLQLPVTKPHPKVAGASVSIGMGDMLYSKEITGALGPDLTLHLLAVYADPRGFNLRNDMAHGLVTSDRLHRGHATRIIHTFLVLGIWKHLVEARKNSQKADHHDHPGPT